MYSTSPTTAQIVIHYVGGESETFNVYDYNQDGGAGEETTAVLDSLREQLQGLLQKPWIFLQLAEETVCINTTNVTRIEVKPLLFPLQVEGLVGSGERVTALHRTR
ncbi:MAG: hypothetical protein VKK80_17005 [Prochlorothrix sp.]|nr:hypothetical protein [Prochlorothrix sp.]